MDLPRSASCALGHVTRVEARACPLFSSAPVKAQGVLHKKSFLDDFLWSI